MNRGRWIIAGLASSVFITLLLTSVHTYRPLEHLQEETSAQGQEPPPDSPRKPYSDKLLPYRKSRHVWGLPDSTSLLEPKATGLRLRVLRVAPASWGERLGFTPGQIITPEDLKRLREHR